MSMSGPPGTDRRAIMVRVLFFGPLAESLGEREVEIAVEFGSSIIELVERLGLQDLVSRGLRVAINSNVVSDLDSVIEDSSEIAFLPPVSGG